MMLSERMQRICGEVLPGGVCADVGTDHGFVPIHLLQSGRVPFCILTDVVDGPLEKARQNLAASGLPAGCFSLRKGNGLSPLEMGEAETVIIAGMGGELIRDILAADPVKAHAVGRFILQPRSRSEVLRKWLTENGYAITRELLAREDSRISEILAAEPVEKSTGKTEIFTSDMDYEIPPLLFEAHCPLLLEFLMLKRSAARQVLENLSNGKSLLNGKKELWSGKLDFIEEKLKQL